MAALLTRALLGAFAGAVLGTIGLGLLADFRFVDYYPAEDGLALVGKVAGVAALAGAFLGVVAGSWEIRGKAQVIVVSVLTGSVVGLFVGVVCGEVVATCSLPSPVEDKDRAVYWWLGVMTGVPGGAVLGGLSGAVVACCRAKGHARPGPPDAEAGTG